MHVYPNYYQEFRCIADRCKHNCCIGWEIDIDPETAVRYKQQTGDIGKRLKESIGEADGVSFFRLAAEDRCPFLNKDNLCDLILALGEESLCEICHLHPRYRNFYTEREEWGLGLCCEEVARILLSQTSPITLVTEQGDLPADVGDEEELEFFRIRRQILTHLQNRQKPLRLRMDELKRALAPEVVDRSLEEWKTELLSLECMDPAWQKILSALSEDAWSWEDGFEEIALENLAVTFSYRHLTKVLDGETLTSVLSFCFLCVRLICAIWHLHKMQNGALTLEDMADTVRLVSAEIEYSPENTDRLIALLDA